MECKMIRCWLTDALNEATRGIADMIYQIPSTCHHVDLPDALDVAADAHLLVPGFIQSQAKNFVSRTKMFT